MGYESLVTTGACTKGNLPDRNQYDIHCPMMGGPAYKPNYVAASCIARQVAGSCSATTCGRKRIQLHKKPSAAKTEPNIYIEGQMYNNKKVAECAECGRQMPIYARGCCAGCVARLKKAGILDEKYPAKRSGRRKPATINQIQAGHTSPANEGTTPELVVTAGETAQPLEVSMASNKTVAACVECFRVMRIVARGLCGKCYSAHRKAGTLDEKYPAKRLPSPRPGFKKKSAKPPTQATRLDVDDIEALSPRALIVFVGDHDVAMAEYLQKLATEERRTIEQQILWLLEVACTDRINGSAE